MDDLFSPDLTVLNDHTGDRSCLIICRHVYTCNGTLFEIDVHEKAFKVLSFSFFTPDTKKCERDGYAHGQRLAPSACATVLEKCGGQKRNVDLYREPLPAAEGIELIPLMPSVPLWISLSSRAVTYSPRLLLSLHHRRISCDLVQSIERCSYNDKHYCVLILFIPKSKQNDLLYNS